MAILETLSLTREERNERLAVLLEELSIAHLAKSKAYALSGGERRRVEITRALVTRPTFILLDEPFAGIDPLAILDIQSIVQQLKERGIGILITDHNVRETLGICDRAYILNEGSVLEEGSPQEIASSRRARELYLGDRFSL
jgi:lipopolysaccharide export system ATP-binding protein